MLSRTLERTLHASLELATVLRHEYATLEHLLVALVDDTEAAAALRACGADPKALRQDLISFLENDLQGLVTEHPSDPKPTAGFQRTVQRAAIEVQSSGQDEITGADVLLAMFAEAESHAVYFLGQHGVTHEAVEAAIPRGPQPAFVALGPGAEMTAAWTLGFEPALRTARLAAPDSLEIDLGSGMTREILHLIRRSRVLVADYTHACDRVYFAAGVAVGLGIPVISTCRADRVAELRRDSCHPDPLAWRTPEELAERLAASLAKVLGGRARDTGDAVEGVLLDAITAAVKSLIALGKERGYVTYGDLNTALPADQVSAELIEDTIATLHEMGIRVVKPDEDDDPPPNHRGPQA
jgi:hypothetical protein